MRKISLSTGKSLVLFDVLVTYILPPFYFMWLGERTYYSTYQNVFPSGYYFVYLCAFLITLFLMFSITERVSLFPKKQTYNHVEKILMSKKVWYGIALLFFMASLNFFLSDFAKYRYDGTGVSSKLGLTLVIAVFCKSIFLIKAGYCVIGYGTNSWLANDKKYWLLISVSMFMTVNGSMSLLAALFLTIATLLSSQFKGIMFVLNNNGTLSLIKKGIILSPFCYLAFLLGETVKRGDINSALDFLSLDNIVFVIFWLMERFTTLYMTLNNQIVAISQDLVPLDHFFYNGTQILTDSINYRLGIITGGQFGDISQSNFYKTTAHFNYFLINDARNPLLSSGASSGILGSAIYTTPFYVSFIFGALYYLLIAKVVDSVKFHFNKPISLIGLFILVFLFRAVLLSPADALLIFDQNFINLIVFIAVSYISFLILNKELK